ncbi:MAG: DUF2490 domain-containing protein [Bacteroidetes bacterium]|nr:DUF2490 domain-containing protein [Bacteroidota bacterium]
MMQRFLFFLLACLLYSFSAKAQYYDDDAKLWLYIKLDKDITKKLNAELSLQNRFDNNISEYTNANANVELTYKLNKHFRFVGGYTYGQKRELNGMFGDREQIYGGFILRKKIKQFLFAYRNLLQASTKNVNSSEKGGVPLYFDKNKFTVKYELSKRVEFFISQELNLSYDQPKYDNISRSRTFAGAIYNLTAKSYLEGYFLFQKHYRYKDQPKRDFVFGLTYAHSF